MNASLRALLHGVLDYAGVFPPASLQLEQAVQHWRTYRTDSASWLLGRFVCPIARLAHLVELGWAANDGPISLLLSAAETEKAFEQQLDDALAAIRSFPHANAIRTIEMVLPPDPTFGSVHGGLTKAITATSDAAASLGSPLTLFLELPAVHDPSSRTHTLLEVLASLNQNALMDHFQVGFKFRTGGTAARAFPTTAELAAVVAASRDAGVPWKATAGLHQPLRHHDTGLNVDAHGFINILMAAALADALKLDRTAIAAILDDDRAGDFVFDDSGAQWRELPVSTADIVTARERGFRSFGSCSFDEPRQTLDALHWL